MYLAQKKYGLAIFFALKIIDTTVAIYLLTRQAQIVLNDTF